MKVPALIECFKKIENIPDAVIFDGQGICHPRRMGIASHMGVLLDIPSIGCAKSHLYGELRMPGAAKGSYTDIKDKDGTVIGALPQDEGGCEAGFCLNRA